MPLNPFAQLALRRAPFMVFAKRAPANVLQYDVDRDFP